MIGTFTGVGTGPGDPSLMTLKAVEVIRTSGVLALPVSDPGLEEPVLASDREERYLENCTAWQIALGAVPEAEDKRKLLLPMPMLKDRKRLDEIHDRDADAVVAFLEQGVDVAFLTLGDPTVYSTCMYLHQRLKSRGYPTAVVPGITSFTAAAARMDMPLVQNREELHVLPASYEISESLGLPGTKVLMKAGRKLHEVKQAILAEGLEAVMVENCGMEGEHIYSCAEAIPEQAGYYSLLVIREKKEKQRREEQ